MSWDGWGVISLWVVLCKGIVVNIPEGGGDKGNGG